MRPPCPRDRRGGAQRVAAPGHHGGGGRQDRRRQCGGRSLLRGIAADAAAALAARSRAVRQPVAGACRPGARARRRGQRIPGRSLDARAIRASGSSTCMSRRCRSGRDHVVVMLQERTIADKMDRQLTHRGAARSVTALAAMLAHEIKNPLSGIRGAAQLLEQRQRRRPHPDAAHLRRGRPHREARRPHGGVHRRAADRARAGQHPRRARSREAARAVGLCAAHQVRRGIRSVAAAGARQPRPADPGVPQPGQERGRGDRRGRARRRDPTHHRIPARRAAVACRAARRACRCRSNSASRTTGRACPTTCCRTCSIRS